MTYRAFLGWLVVAVVTVVAALAVVVGRPTSSVDPLSREPVFTELRANPDGVARLTIASRFGAFTFVRAQGEWRAPDKYDYPVDSNDVRELVVKLSDMRYIERKTSNPERFERLEVNDIEDELSESVHVRMADAEDRVLAEVIIGRPSARFIDGSVSGTYIRFPEAVEVWLASGAVNVQTRQVPWLDREIVTIPADTVARVVVGSGDGAYEVVREGDGDAAEYVVPQVPEGRKLADRVTQSLTRSLADVALEDVRPRSEFAMPEDARVARVETRDGVAVALRLAEIDQRPWVTVDASYIGGADDTSEAAKAARQTVAGINARVGTWVYWIPSDIFDRLTKPLEEQLEPVKKEGES
jgi:hypothetical protein